jgi:Zn-dependent M28 family amino/carboxypeptidase
MIWIFLIFALSLFLLITQPTFLLYKIDKNVIETLSIVSENNLEKYVKYFSENNRTTIEWKEKIIKYILEQLKNNWTNKKNIEIQSYNAYWKIYKNIIIKYWNEKNNDWLYIIWAHYDTDDNPWADDNASSIAWLLEINKVLNKIKFEKNIELVFYTNEEMPFYDTNEMWSYIHAKSVKNKNIKLVVILEMIWYFSEQKNSQEYPINFLSRFYPNEWNYIAIVSNLTYFWETRKIKSLFKSYLKINNLIDVYSINWPNIINWIDFSDHRNYWKFNIPALMITDTSFYRNKNYHTKTDTYEKLNYRKMREVIISVLVNILNY